MASVHGAATLKFWAPHVGRPIVVYLESTTSARVFNHQSIHRRAQPTDQIVLLDHALRHILNLGIADAV
jgi:hypothetical protein